jgi:hypothetical protein
MKRLFFLASSVLALAACDPLIQIDTTVTVPAGIQQTLASFPQEVVIDAGMGRGPERVFVICDPDGAQDIVLTRFTQQIGCAEETTVRAWVSAFTPAPNEELICGEQVTDFFVSAANAEPQPLDPIDLEVVFQEELDDVLVGCASASAEVSLVVSVE